MLEREFQNMFLFSHGFEAATLKIPASNNVVGQQQQIIGFAKFRTRLQALEARDVLSGKKVDVEKGCVLKAEMAKKNLHTKRVGGGTAAELAAVASGMASAVAAQHGQAQAQAVVLTGGGLTQGIGMGLGTAGQPLPSQSLPLQQTPGGLRNAFSRCPGFRRLCFRSKSNGPIVFVEFDDVMYATQALQDMYGHTLGGLIKGGIRLSYSKVSLANV
ncbi:hypothetical protein T439DRAFT_282694 [Meredithblackwellia eburnea MCA 4105]